mmetsp:Transcript_72441/g.212562  ORF Transcript_72441/g.212562 Transcript_72441/m.212562 type:complete len:319 (-) Transcript_72441:1624-2580(-)
MARGPGPAGAVPDMSFAAQRDGLAARDPIFADPLHAWGSLGVAAARPRGHLDSHCLHLRAVQVGHGKLLGFSVRPGQRVGHQRGHRRHPTRTARKGARPWSALPLCRLHRSRDAPRAALPRAPTGPLRRLRDLHAGSASRAPCARSRDCELDLHGSAGGRRHLLHPGGPPALGILAQRRVVHVDALGGVCALVVVRLLVPLRGRLEQTRDLGAAPPGVRGLLAGRDHGGVVRDDGAAGRAGAGAVSGQGPGLWSHPLAARPGRRLRPWRRGEPLVVLEDGAAVRRGSRHHGAGRGRHLVLLRPHDLLGHAQAPEAPAV